MALMRSKTGKVFGGYTSKGWDSVSKWREDAEAYIFSLDRLQVYRVKTPGKALYCRDDWGPSFGGCALGFPSGPFNYED